MVSDLSAGAKNSGLLLLIGIIVLGTALPVFGAAVTIGPDTGRTSSSTPGTPEPTPGTSPQPGPPTSSIPIGGGGNGNDQPAPSGGGGGSSGGTADEFPECQDVWFCYGWSACVDGQQTRECEQQTACANSDTPAPAQVQSCGAPPAAPPEPVAVCTEGERSCEGSTVIECTANEWVTLEVCEFGCAAAACLPGSATEQPAAGEAESQQDAPSPQSAPSLTGLLTQNARPIALGAIALVIVGILVYVFHSARHQPAPAAAKEADPKTKKGSARLVGAGRKRRKAGRR